ncbi:MAG: penicillin-binding protein 2 [Alphaproteobacteria bacterium]|nr:penicillin-binding protein 2 [Alphaproteobacteria bacterium]
MSQLSDGRDHLRYEMLTRRTVVAGAGTLALFGVLAGRMYQLQILERDKYATLAEDNRINIELIAPPRGRILDRFGMELASNRQNFGVILIPERAPSVEKALAALERYVPLTDKQRERVMREAKRNRAFVPILVADNLSWEQFAAINFHTPDLEGLQPQVGETRHYPFADRMSHVLGYVAAVSEKDLEDADPLLQLPGFRIGKLGIERTEEKRLRGRAGTRRIEVNASGRVIRELARMPGQPGEDLKLTLDMEIQKFAQARLAEESAACVVMDVHNGDVLAFVSNPGFDPNEFNKGITQASYQALLNDEKKPLINKAIAGQFPPGSTFKMVVAIAAIENNVISPESTVSCSGAMGFGSHVFHCWKRGGHGPMNMVSGIKNSCDVYFYELARRLGIDKLAEMARRFGLGQTYGFELPGERPGLVPDRAWKLATRGEEWHQGETLITGIGQGALLATPLQLCVMTARVANGTKAVVPRLVRPAPGLDANLPEPPPLAVSARAIQIVQAGMNAVTNQGGTAARSRIDIEGFEMAGKTGTSQVRRITADERARGIRKNEDLPWRLRDHALFVAYAPTAAPRYAISLIVQHGGGGSKAAAPPARDIMLLTLQRDPSRLASESEKPGQEKG